MKIQELFETMNQIDPNLLKPAGFSAALCDLAQTAREITDQAEVHQALIAYQARFPRMQGWLCRQSDVVQINAGRLPDAAPIQYGELAGDAHHSLFMRPNGCGGLRWITLVEKAGDRYLAVAHRHLGRPRAPDDRGPVRNLLYRVYWDRGDASSSRGFVPAATRFTGFEGLAVTP
ncbi:hypothetical protein [Acanthopleuribacter pedis]|uniref:Uncharacterized protein n=1 Tax=Acanthopleuribacter pedis TaxID=442870 RepID=A0A8J7QD70_9BACT|nr:hypothetical protein [Acanthopleuribacter pedis]MBO1321969.1 hypothetical protein [Acanthopleuribacter pedis]